MFRKLFLLGIFTGLLLSASFADAQNNRGGAFERGRIDRQVRKEVLTLPYYGIFDAIGFTSNGGTVTLTGYVTRPTTKNDAEEAVADISGVDRVINNIEVLPNSPSDDRLRRRLLQTFVNRGGGLYRYFMGTNTPVRLIVNHGRVSLEGFADTRGDANQMYILARGVSGALGVTNNLKVVSDMAR